MLDNNASAKEKVAAAKEIVRTLGGKNTKDTKIMIAQTNHFQKAGKF